MKMIVKKVIGKIVEKPRKFFPMVNEQGIAEKPKKFFPMTECEYLLEQRRKGIYGNGQCLEKEF